MLNVCVLAGWPITRRDTEWSRGTLVYYIREALNFGYRIMEKTGPRIAPSEISKSSVVATEHMYVHS